MFYQEFLVNFLCKVACCEVKRIFWTVDFRCYPCTGWHDGITTKLAYHIPSCFSMIKNFHKHLGDKTSACT